MMNNYEQSLLSNTIRKEKLFLFLSIASVVMGVTLGAYYAWKGYMISGHYSGIQIVVVILILLNARQNLRQHYLAKILIKLHQEKSDISAKVPSYPINS